MEIETIKMSSKGQIVIPQDVREDVNAGEGTVFAVIGTNDTIVLKKINTPSKEDLITALEEIAKKGKQHLQRKGFKETDIPKLVEQTRRK